MGEQIPAPVASSGVPDIGAGARALLEALAVLGSGRFTLVEAAAVAGVNPDEAVDELQREDLVKVDIAFGTYVSIAAASIRDEVYASIPSARRRRLHARAGAGMPGREGLRHLTLAAPAPDEGLAEELERHARQLHAEARHGDASEMWEWASALSADVDDRNRRSLEGDVDRVLAGEVDAVEASLSRRVATAPEYTLLLGLIEVWRERWHDAADVLSEPVGTLEPRGWALLAGARLRAGRPEIDIRSALEEVMDADLSEFSPAFARFSIQARAMLTVRHSRVEDATPRGPAREISPTLTYGLAVRGAANLMDGAFDDAAVDLREVSRRVRVASGVRGDGALYALLGGALWFGGQLERADEAFDRSRASAWDHDNPLKLALSSLGAVGSGDMGRADRILARAREVLRGDPWHEALVSYVVARGVRLHAGNEPDRRAQEAGRLRRDFGSDALDPGASPRLMWALYRGLLAVWDRDEEGAMACAARLAADADVSWTDAASLWLRMQVAEMTGADPTPLSERLIRQPIARFPLLEAYIGMDVGRVRDDRVLLKGALTSLDAVGIAPYVSPAIAPSDVLAALTDRESDVVELLTAGMSYAQIGKRLFLSPSTVKFHLSRVYAKAGVSGRHELAGLLRGSAAS